MSTSDPENPDETVRSDMLELKSSVQLGHKSAMRMPSSEDKLFRFDASDKSAWFLLTDELRALEVGYAHAYRSAAQVLVETASKDRRPYLDFPIVFLYRHHTELVIKNIIRRVLYLLGRGPTQEEQNHLDKHRLDALWTDLKLQIKALNKLESFASLPALEEAAVDNYIAQLTAFDRISFSFRYPASKKGMSTLPKDFKDFNLRHFAQLMERLAHHLEELDNATLDVVDAMDEAEGPYGYDAD